MTLWIFCYCRWWCRRSRCHYRYLLCLFKYTFLNHNAFTVIISPLKSSSNKNLLIDFSGTRRGRFTTKICFCLFGPSLNNYGFVKYNRQTDDCKKKKKLVNWWKKIQQKFNCNQKLRKIAAILLLLLLLLFCLSSSTQSLSGQNQ